MARWHMGEDRRGKQRSDGTMKPMPRTVELCPAEKTLSAPVQVRFGARLGSVSDGCSFLLFRWTQK